jgi:hypothetical protein
MDSARFDSLPRSLFAAGSRRAVGRALAGLTVGAILFPLPDGRVAAAKGKGKRKKKKNPQALVPKCAVGEVPCSDLGCCAANLCTSCGCCPATQPSCCGNATTVNRLCYSSSDEQCCPVSTTGLVGACPRQTFCGLGAGGLVPICCPSGSEHCGAGCCAQGQFCCPALMMCCLDSSCDPGVAACVNIAGGQLARIS